MNPRSAFPENLVEWTQGLARVAFMHLAMVIVEGAVDIALGEPPTASRYLAANGAISGALAIGLWLRAGSRALSHRTALWLATGTGFMALICRYYWL